MRGEVSWNNNKKVERTYTVEETVTLSPLSCIKHCTCLEQYFQVRRKNEYMVDFHIFNVSIVAYRMKQKSKITAEK